MRLELTRVGLLVELSNLYTTRGAYMKVTVIPIRALGTITKGFVPGLEDLEIREQKETIQTPVLLR